MLDALFLGNHNWILPAPIVFTPFSCFHFFQELMLILLYRVACFANSFFRSCLSSLIFQVSLVVVPSTLDSSCRHISGDKNVGGCFLDTLELWGFLPGMVVSCAFSPFYQFGIMAWNLFPFSLSFCCCLLAIWREVKKRLPLVRSGAEKGLAGIRLLQVASFLLYTWRS